MKWPIAEYLTAIQEVSSSHLGSRLLFKLTAHHFDAKSDVKLVDEQESNSCEEARLRKKRLQDRNSTIKLAHNALTGGNIEEAARILGQSIAEIEGVMTERVNP